MCDNREGLSGTEPRYSGRCPVRVGQAFGMRRLCTRGLVLASLVLLLLVGIVRLGAWPPWWWLEVVDTFALYAFVPFVGAMVLAWRLRSRAFAAISIGAALLFAQQVGPAWTQQVRGSDHLAVIADLEPTGGR